MILTIAIPTYNRLKELKKAVSNLIFQIEQSSSEQKDIAFELFISNNASEDGTAEFLELIKKQYKFVSIHHELENKGIDENIHNCAKYSKGDYVFTLSDDDTLVDRGLSYILPHIGKNDFIFLNGYIYSGTNSGITENRIFLQNQDEKFTTASSFVNKLQVWATFVSSFIYHRKKWLKVETPEIYFGTQIYLTYMLYGMLINTNKMLLIGSPLIAIKASYTGNYHILKAFCFEFNHLLLNESVNKWGYSKDENILIYKKIVNGTLPGKIISFRSYNKGKGIQFSLLRDLVNKTKIFPISCLLLIILSTAPFPVAMFINNILSSKFKTYKNSRL